MRRIGLILTLLLVAGATAVATAGADDKKSYQAELFNAFGLVKGSELRVAGVKAGTITDLDITPEKNALVSFEVDPEFPELKADASCSSEPQSLIAEYFLDCQPGTSDQPLEGPIEAGRNQTTVQNDLVQNTLREPFKRRFQLLINEFGTALVGNSERLNAAIRAGAPALRELSKVLEILGRQNTIIAELNANSDAVFQQLTDRREDVVRFIDEAEDTARVSAERREDLARDFDLLDDFLAELRPTMVELANLARQQTPLLTDLRAAAPGLNKLGRNLPRFNNASRVSLKSLGRASDVGRRALAKSTEEIAALDRASQKAFPAADIVAKFLVSLDDPKRAVEEDCDARYDLREQPGEADARQTLLEQRIGSPLTGTRNANEGCAVPPGAGPVPGAGNPGYTGLEGLLNYAYVQTVSLNVFDQIGHGLAIQIVGEGAASEGGECGEFSAGGPLTGGASGKEHGGWPKTTPGDNTRDIREAAHCVAALGDYQPGITPGTIGEGGRTKLGSTTLPPYDSSVCSPPVAIGTTHKGICDPFAPSLASAGARSVQGTQQQDQQQDQQQGQTVPGGKQQQGGGALTPEELRELLGLPSDAPLPSDITDALGTTEQESATDLLNFLFGP